MPQLRSRKRWLIVIATGTALFVVAVAMLYPNRLHIASYWGKAATVEWLLDRGADPNRSGTVWTVYHPMSARPLSWAIRSRDPEVVRVLASRGAELDGRLLHLAIFYNNLQALQVLVDAGADLNLTIPPNGGTPLHEAVWGRKNEAASIILQAGADPGIPSKSGETALDAVVALSRMGHPELLDEMIDVRGVDASYRYKSVEGVSLLMIVSKSGGRSCVRRVLEAGADGSAADNLGRTALDWAHLRELKARDDIVQLLQTHQ